LGGILSVAAQNITVKFEVENDDVVVNKIITKFSTKELVRGKVYELNLTDIQSEERRDLLCSLSIPNCGTATDHYPLVKVTVSYFNVISGQNESTVNGCVITRGEHSNVSERRDYRVDKQYNRLLAAQAMDQANDEAAKGNLEKARAILKAARGRISESVSAQDEFCQNLVGDIQRCESGLSSRAEYESGGSKMLTNQMNAHYVQRSSNVSWQSQQVYNTTARSVMQTQFKSNNN